VEKHFKKPVILYNYPKEIKAFYMRQNDDNKRWRLMTSSSPAWRDHRGSQREERYENLLRRIHELNLPETDLWWYLELRKIRLRRPHSGFGLALSG